ncbi:MAG: NAD-dependent epimerase/dehydratase family protein [Candidatus Aenigmatarchaeota archaeon]
MIILIEDDVKNIQERISQFKPQIKNKTFLVTGGAGFLGSWVCDVLVEMDGKVICLDNFSSGKRKNIEHLLSRENFTLIEGDVSKEDFLELPKIKNNNFDYVLHLAARADPKDYQEYPIETMETDSFGTYYTLKLAERDDALYYFSSTSEVYGDPEEHPQEEDYWGNVNPNGKRACYDESKRFSEALIMNFYRQKGLEVKMNRIFNTYGPRLQDGRALPTFISQCLNNEPITVYGDGKQTRSLCYVTDLIVGLFKTIFGGENAEVYNLGNPEEMTILELAKKVKKMINTNSEIVFEPLPEDDPLRRKPSVDKAKRHFDFNTTVDLEDGINKTIEWFKEVKG